MTQLIPRGIRVNNPLNLEKGQPWQGLSDDQSADDRFCTFKNPVFGLRAAMKVLMTYFDKHGLKTVWDIISRFAPPDENPTAAYATHVAEQIGVGIHDPIDLTQEQQMINFVKGQITMEEGPSTNFPNWLFKDTKFWYADSTYAAAWDAMKNTGE